MQVRSLGLKDPLEEGMATCSSILAWKTPWMESGGLQSTRLHPWGRVGYSPQGCKESDTTEVT